MGEAKVFKAPMTAYAQKKVRLASLIGMYSGGIDRLLWISNDFLGFDRYFHELQHGISRSCRHFNYRNDMYSVDF
jgi:hypothetical protein